MQRSKLRPQGLYFSGKPLSRISTIVPPLIRISSLIDFSALLMKGEANALCSLVASLHPVSNSFS